MQEGGVSARTRAARTSRAHRAALSRSRRARARARDALAQVVGQARAVRVQDAAIERERGGARRRRHGALCAHGARARVPPPGSAVALTLGCRRSAPRARASASRGGVAAESALAGGRGAADLTNGSAARATLARHG
jgi:hypothetical protein